MSVVRPLSQESTMIEFEGKAKSPLNKILMYGSLAIALGFVIFILLAERSVKNQIATINAEHVNVSGELAKPSYADIIDESKAFEIAVNNLSELVSKRVSKADILSELYKYITKDVRIETISLGEDGSLNLDGHAGSYRSVADFMLGLRSFPRASDVVLVNVQLDSSEGIPEKERFVFNITAKLNLDKIVEPEEVTPTESTESDDGAEVAPVDEENLSVYEGETSTDGASGLDEESQPGATEIIDDSSNTYEGY